MRQKLAKRIKREAYGDLSPRDRKYAWIGGTVVTDRLRAWYQRAKKVVYAKMHPAKRLQPRKKNR